MPLYEYRCDSCGKQIEQFQKHTEPAPSCIQCLETMKKLISRSSFALKGDGWAKDGYGSKANGK